MCCKLLKLFALLFLVLGSSNFSVAMNGAAVVGAAIVLMPKPVAMPHHVYNTIAQSPISNAEKNGIIAAVNAALPNQNHFARDSAIDNAVANNGNHPGLAQVIKDAVDAALPLLGG